MRFAHRRGKKRVKIEGSAGMPVKVKQVRHEMLFGCSEFTTLPYASGEPDDETVILAEKRYAHMAELMNFVTLPFYWGRYEPTEGKPDFERMKKAARFLREKGITMKGHPLCWHTSCAPWLMEYDNDRIFKTQLQRITRDITEFSGLIDMWDVINEAVIMPLFNKYDNAITRICKERGRISLIRDLFNTARAANENATLLINDFETGEAYDILIEGLLESGVKIDHIGIQSHMHQGYWGLEKTEEILERFGRFNLPLHFTEISLVSGHIMPAEIVDLNDYKVNEWPSTPEGEARQAEEAVTHYEKLFEHPLVKSITWWSFHDGLWLGAPSGLLDKNSNPKPVYKALHKRIKGDWWMDEKNFTIDNDGFITVEGFKGDYLASCEGVIIPFDIL